MRSAGTLRYKVEDFLTAIPTNLTVAATYSNEVFFIIINFYLLHRNWPTCMTHCIVHTVKWQRSCTRARGCSAPTSEWLSLVRWDQLSNSSEKSSCIFWLLFLIFNINRPMVQLISALTAFKIIQRWFQKRAQVLIWSPLQSNSHCAWRLLRVFFVFVLFLKHDHMQWHFMTHSNTRFCFSFSLKAAVSCAVTVLSSLSPCVVVVLL